MGVLYAVMLKIDRSKDNMLSNTLCKFNDCVTGGQLYYDWGKIRPTVTRVNHILTSATTPSFSDHTATLTAVLTTHAKSTSCYAGPVHFYNGVSCTV